MNNDKVDEVLRSICDLLKTYGCTPLRLEGEALAMKRPNADAALSHAYALAVAALELGPEKLEKKFRRLGWIQGVLWSFGLQSIAQAKRANMPAEELSK